MLQRIFLIFVLVLSLNSCSKKDIEYEPKVKNDAYKLYQEGFGKDSESMSKIFEELSNNYRKKIKSLKTQKF